MSKKSELSKEALVQSIMYHSRVERTSKYIQILNGLETLAIEGSTFHINAVLNNINNNEVPSFSEVLEIMGMVPGTLGKAAKGLKILDFGNRTLENLTGGSTKMKQFAVIETNVRSIINTIYDRVKNHPELKKQINQYLREHLGEIGSSVEDIIYSSPQYADHLKLKVLNALTSENQEKLNNIQNDVEIIKEKITDWLNTQLNEQKYFVALKEIEAYSTYGKLLGKIVGFKNNKLGNQIMIMTESYRNTANIVAAVSAKKMAAGLATANYALIAINMIEAFSKDDSSGISKAISELQSLIIKATESILNRLDEIDGRLIEIQQILTILYREVLEQGRDIRDLHMKVDRLKELFTRKTDLLLNAARAGFSRELDEAVVRAVGHKNIWKPGYFKMSSEEHRNLIFKLYTHSAVHAADALSNISNQREYSITALLDELNSTDLESNLSYLSRILAKITQQLYPRINVDVGMWSLATSVLLDLIGDWPEYQDGLETEFLEEIKKHGIVLKKFIDTCQIKNSIDEYLTILNKVRQHSERLVKLHASYIPEELLKILQGQGQTNPQIVASDIDWTAFKLDSFSEAFKCSDMGVKVFNVSVQYTGNTVWGSFTTNISKKIITTYLPAEVKCAMWLGGRLTGLYRHDERHDPNGPPNESPSRSLVDYEFYIDLHLKLPQASSETTYRVLHARCEDKRYLGGMWIGNYTKESVTRQYIENLVSKHEYNTQYKSEITENLNRLLSNMRPMLQSPSLQLSQLVNEKASRMSKSNDEIRSIRGLIELLWQTIIIGSTEKERMELEPFFIGKHSPSIDISHIGSVHSANEVLKLYKSKLRAVKNKLKEVSEMPDEKSEDIWSILNINKNIFRLNKCIDAVNNKRLYKTRYGKLRYN